VESDLNMRKIAWKRRRATLNGGAYTVVKNDHPTRCDCVDFIVRSLCLNKVQQKSTKCQGVMPVFGVSDKGWI